MENDVSNLDFLVIILGIATIIAFSFISFLEMAVYRSILRNKKLI